MQMTNNSGIKSTASFQIIPNLAQLKTLKVSIMQLFTEIKTSGSSKDLGKVQPPQIISQSVRIAQYLFTFDRLVSPSTKSIPPPQLTIKLETTAKR